VSIPGFRVAFDLNSTLCEGGFTLRDGVLRVDFDLTAQ
jgi:hypothetical protein